MYIGLTVLYACTRLFRAQELKLKTQHLQNMFDMFQYQFLKIFEISALIQIPRNSDFTIYN